MDIKTVGIIGYGHFGAFLAHLAERFVPDVHIKVYSRRFPPDGERFFSLEETAACDVVIFCSSIHDYEDQLVAALPHMRQDTIFVDVATVKGYTTGLFRKHDGKRQWISTHPMFGPESYQKQNEDVHGFRIVVTDHTLPEATFAAVREALSALGFVIIEMSADEHDKLLAETLFLTHYIGQTMQEGGFLRTTMDTVSFSYLMDAVESVIHDKKLFEDVYRHNPYCKEVAERFHAAQKRVLQQLPDHQ